MRQLALLALLICGALASSSPALAGAMFMGLGDLSGGIFQSRANAVSADGSVVVGEGNSASGNEAFRWTQATGIVGLGFLTGETTSRALAVSDDGSVVAGASGSTAARWVDGSGWQDLSGGLPPADISIANGVSPDGATVVGHYLSPFMGADTGAFIWREIGGTSLYLQDDVPWISSITGISGDVIVMSAWTGVYDSPQALRFTESGSQTLPSLSEVFQFWGSTAEAISADGTTIVGQSWGQAFRWQSGTGTVGLGILNPEGSQAYSIALAASADGGVVVGISSELICNPFPNCVEDDRAFVWTPRRGLIELRVELESLGLDLAGWTLAAATGVSADGTVIVGRGINPSGKTEAWIAIIPEPSTAVEIDIKPGSDPNSINPLSRGVIPVAILTTEDFDALTVDADSVLFGPDEAEKRHKQAHVEDVDGDGDLDLLLHFRTQETGIALGDTEACVIGQTYDGVPIMGCDSVRTVPPGGSNAVGGSSAALTTSCGNGFAAALVLPPLVWIGGRRRRTCPGTFLNVQC
jgi:probable HAF family extracellular repeat protein